jgi:uncharacterized protein (TIGR02246 family)
MALTAADVLEIMELAARYNWAIDHRNAEEWADVFTEDGKFVAYGQTRCEGRAQMLAYIEKARAAGHKSRHWICNSIIEEGGAPDTARLRLYVMAINISDGIQPYIMGDYDDTLVKVNGKWKFKLRNVNLCAGKSWTQGGLSKAASK